MRMPPTSNTYENHQSRLLDLESNLALGKLLGSRCISLATAVVQLYATDPPDHQHWHKRKTGVMCYVKDNIRKNYFFRLYSLQRNGLVWEQEMYNNMEYTESTSFLHHFEAENCIVALNFADGAEASHFKSVVDMKIAMRRRKIEKKAQRHSQNFDSRVVKAPPIDFASKPAKRLDGRKIKQKITKADISKPTDFKHISHVGWNAESGFDINSTDAELTNLFEKAGVSEKQLQDRETREFIYDFINRHGGREAVAEENNQMKKSPAPVPGPPIPPRGAATQRAPHIRAAPPPPPSLSERAPPPPAFKPAVPPPPPGGFTAAAPPPPPPPMLIENAAPPVPPMSNDNSALLQSIRSGTTLKPVEDRKIAPVEDGRSDLLSEIRKGFKLKPVDEREVRPCVNGPIESNSKDLAGALARALAERSKAIHSEDDDDDSDEDDNEDEWDD